MTSITYPENLPNIRASGYSAQFDDPVIRTAMDAGSVKQRLRYTAVPMQINGTIILNMEERAIFENWFVNTLGYGTLRFIMENPATGTREEFRFTKTYSEIEIEGLFEISLSLERIP